MRNEFHDALDGLTADLGDMCGRAGAMMRSATMALLEAESSEADRLQVDLKRLTSLGAAVHDRAYSLLALQAPVARDLRTLVAALHIAADADRMGALAAHVARTAKRRYPDCAVPPEVRDLFDQMGVVAVDLAALTQSAVLACDAEEAERVSAGDDRMDDLHRQLFARVITDRWQHGPTAAADVVLVGRFYERFADHAVEIARRVYFQATGTHLGAASSRL
ncbi:phosphate transport system regulatory protein PhoU [Mycolicibacterium chubuense NBB4]|uniref:Phosphate-specific transport system accessory protein PhoU n=1 Tax=Mycolicibacterium chubuense (strain NBB4) TaxID=710421 RepID=I4BJL2_MYCCN|nr:phosphate signaling complex protein PhoU [Mycolicibacterium chubuense]AFM17469.1 phosphate transport system regulatory protein PhoU [Mycolicibacterium chubuense NBB4]